MPCWLILPDAVRSMPLLGMRQGSSEQEFHQNVQHDRYCEEQRQANQLGAAETLGWRFGVRGVTLFRFGTGATRVRSIEALHIRIPSLSTTRSPCGAMPNGLGMSGSP